MWDVPTWGYMWASPGAGKGCRERAVWDFITGSLKRLGDHHIHAKSPRDSVQCGLGQKTSRAIGRAAGHLTRASSEALPRDPHSSLPFALPHHSVVSPLAGNRTSVRPPGSWDDAESPTFPPHLHPPCRERTPRALAKMFPCQASLCTRHSVSTGTQQQPPSCKPATSVSWQKGHQFP